MNTNKKRLHLTRKILQEYSRKTTIHGIQFIGDIYRPYCERLWWLLAFIFSLVLCGMFINNILDKLERNPVMVSFANKPVSVLQVPLPGITLCPQNKFRRRNLNVTRINELYEMGKLSNATKWVIIQDLINQVCPGIPDFAANFRNISNYNILRTLKNLSPAFDDTFIKCIAKSSMTYIPCDIVFRKVFTSRGLCYTFNGLMPDDLYRNNTVYEPFENSYGNLTWSQEEGYKDPLAINYPLNAIGGLFGEVFVLILNQFEFDIDMTCDIFQGFKIFLHSPSDVPIMKEEFIKIPALSDVRIAISANQIITSKELKQYPPEKRGCVFNSERYLTFFKVYTEDNCWMECLANFTLRECGCVFFYMPRFKSTPVCSLGSQWCGELAKYKIESETIYNRDPEKHITSECNCMPTCTSLSYSYETTYSIENTNLLMKRYFDNWTIGNYDMDKFMPISVQIFYANSHYIPIKRTELFSKTDLVASCGGILGLFMGFSVLSFMEIVYYCLIRPMGLFLRNWRNERNGLIRQNQILKVKPITKNDKRKKFKEYGFYNTDRKNYDIKY